MHKDFLDQKLSEGDEVVFMDRYYQKYQRGHIRNFGNTKATVEYSGKNYQGETILKTTFRDYHRLIKIDSNTENPET